MRPLHKNDWLLGIIALFLAVITYYYVLEGIHRAEMKTYDPSYELIKLTAKTVPIKVRFASNPPEGYRLIPAKVDISPPTLVVIGPEAILEKASSAETAIIDISQTTKKTVKRIPIESVAGFHLSGEDYYVDVVIPIEKIEVK
jgi:YbbR domain-containing protein